MPRLQRIMLTLLIISCIWFIPIATLEASENLTNNYNVDFPKIISSYNDNNYYVDSINGSDANPGNTPTLPWQTLAPVHSNVFSPGSVIHFKRGSSWNSGLRITDSGTPDKPILFTTYGTGSRPIFENPGDSSNWTRSITIDSDWVILEGVLVTNAHEAGVYISTGADHNVIRNIEATNVGMGVRVHGEYNLITANDIHDLHMVHNTPGGNDDFGAVGIWLFNSNNEVSYNRLENCKAPSYDYKFDGGAVEFWGEVHNSYVHHNYSIDSKGFIEVGGGSAHNNILAHNIIVDTHGSIAIHLDGYFGSDIQNLRFENNTIVDRRPEQTWTVIYSGGTPTENTLLLRNNIFYLTNYTQFANVATFTHDHNIYYFENPNTRLGFELGIGEKIADPLFVNLDSVDFHLIPDSPAVDTGIDLGYIFDFDGNPVPNGKLPDIGAYEYQFYSLTVILAGSGGGLVTGDGISCGTATGADCIEAYDYETQVTLKAIPDDDSNFAGWSGACTGTGDCTFTVDAAKNVTATFNPDQSKLSVSLSGDGSGSVTSAPAGISCGTHIGSDCSESYEYGTLVTLMAIPDIYSKFTGWSGACFGTGECSITMTETKLVTATFESSSPIPPNEKFVVFIPLTSR